MGSTSFEGDDYLRAANGVVHNVKNVRYGINKKKFSQPDDLPMMPPFNDAIRDDPASDYAPLTETSLGSNHPGGAHVGMCDGSARFLQDDVDVEAVLLRMASRAVGRYL